MEGKLFNWVVTKSDLMLEPLPGTTLIELMSDKRVLIQHHHGVTFYCCNEIHVKVSFGILSIVGCSMEVAQMTKEQLVITGSIESVILKRGCK